MMKLGLFGVALGAGIIATSALAAPAPPVAQGPATTIVTPQLPVEQVVWYRGRHPVFWHGPRWRSPFHRRWVRGRWRHW